MQNLIFHPDRPGLDYTSDKDGCDGGKDAIKVPCVWGRYGEPSADENVPYGVSAYTGISGTGGAF